MRARPDPFGIREGVLCLEELGLERLTAELEGVSAAWLLSGRAVEQGLGPGGEPRSLSLHLLEPPALLAWAARGGCWARVLSSRELETALASGFPADHIVAGGRVKEDGFVKDALTAAVGAFEAAGSEDRRNVRRIAAGLGHAEPVFGCGPPAVPEDAFARCGGLLVRVLRSAPAVAIDAPWSSACGEGGETDVFALAPGSTRDGSLEGLSRPGCAGGTPARLHGDVARGDWVVIRSTSAAAVHADDGTHGEVPRILVQGTGWRLLEGRPRREGRAGLEDRATEPTGSPPTTDGP